jgi:Prokaryotic E2 family E
MNITKAETEITRLSRSGMGIALVKDQAQPYALVRGLEAPFPPWDKGAYDILIPIPVAFDMGAALDGFYLGLPYKFQGGDHNRVSGATITLEKQEWRLVSWHYPDGKAFRENVDTIESHITHCRGFFMERGAVNART